MGWVNEEEEMLVQAKLFPLHEADDFMVLQDIFYLGKRNQQSWPLCNKEKPDGENDTQQHTGLGMAPPRS